MWFNPAITFICEEMQEQIIRTYNGEYSIVSVDDILDLHLLVNRKTFLTLMKKGGDKYVGEDKINLGINKI
jgi:hypothetical protein